MPHLHNLSGLKTLRQHLRNNSTPAEAALWSYLKQRRLRGRKFRRQHSVGPFIFDFYCPSERLAVELDGVVHDDSEQADYDAERTNYLELKRIRVIRVENALVFRSPESVLEYIASHFQEE